jgi:hypothetical protein
MYYATQVAEETNQLMLGNLQNCYFETTIAIGNAMLWNGIWGQINYIATISHCSRGDAWFLFLHLLASEDHYLLYAWLTLFTQRPCINLFHLFLLTIRYCNGLFMVFILFNLLCNSLGVCPS